MRLPFSLFPLFLQSKQLAVGAAVRKAASFPLSHFTLSHFHTFSVISDCDTKNAGARRDKSLGEWLQGRKTRPAAPRPHPTASHGSSCCRLDFLRLELHGDHQQAACSFLARAWLLLVSDPSRVGRLQWLDLAVRALD